MFLLHEVNISLTYDLGFKTPRIQVSFPKYKNTFVETVTKLAPM